MKRNAAIFIALAGALTLTGCGFQPIYATREGASPVNSQIYLKQIIAPENVAPYLEDALNTRIVSADGVAPRYELIVQATESADRLAVQIDATVTRYNYRLGARYWVIDNQTGESVRGVAKAITSYNIVNSQYSTLFAERTAVEKAARELAEEIERDILIRFSRPEKERDDVDPDAFQNILDEEDVLPGRRRDKAADTDIPAELYYLSPEISSETEGGADTPATEDGAPEDGADPDVPDPVIDGRP